VCVWCEKKIKPKNSVGWEEEEERIVLSGRRRRTR
jgi:hypothetical protein